MDPVYVIGTSMTRFGPLPEAGVKSLTREAVGGALADAALPAAAVEAVFFANATQGVVEGQVSTPGQFALHAAGVTGVPVVNVENACASAATAFWLACTQVRSGGADTVLAVGAEKMVYPGPDRAARVFDSFLGALDVERAQESLDRVLALGADVPGRSGEGRRTVMMDLYAGLCRAHMRRFGTTREQLALIASKNHGHAALNDKCHYDRPMSPEQVLAGRPLAYPLTVPMCAPLSDGAAAAVVCNRSGLDRLPRAVRSRAVRVRACELRSATDRAWDDFDRHVVRRAALAAYERAGVRAEQVDLAEVHDAAAFGELFAAELLGLAPLGGGGRLAESGDTRLGGAIPINTSGGLESRGHPIGATGLAQIHELVTQLRGEAGARQVRDASVGVQENGGAFLGVEEAAAVVTVLSSGG
ncbi:thiolase family protein [Streptomyces sp. V4-01]|uniref:Thiolase family protein n=1 Tax=Actinacidiphila polyblastidii TaxID=3110430 RepID=A0ABU7P3S5_9ACTN|nr:thiolase family protein [Streptomyces sp. V4-01]